MAKALVFGDDTGPSLAVARSLGRRGVEVHLAGRGDGLAASCSRYVTRCQVLPDYVGAGHTWVERIEALISEFGFDLLIPTSDSSLAQLAKHRDVLGSHRIAVPNAEALDAFTDKVATRRLAQANDVPVARGVEIGPFAPPSELREELHLPMVLKRRRSYACGEIEPKSPVRLVRTLEQLQRELAYERFELAEEFLPGFCRGLSVIAREGQILIAHQHRRLRQEHVTGPASARVSETCDPQLLEWTARLTAATRLTGVAMFEYRHSPSTGRTVLLEVNPRFWGSLPLALAAGADFPAMLFAMLVEDRAPAASIGSRPGVEKRNLSGEHHALAVALEEARFPSDYLRLACRLAETSLRLVSGRRFDSWAADDPRPFRAERRELLVDFGRFCARRFGGGGRRRAAPVQ